MLAVSQQFVARIGELEGRLRQDSQNSSRPPSSDAPATRRPERRLPSGCKPGAQSGLKGISASCSSPRPSTELCWSSPGGADAVTPRCTAAIPPPRRHQVTELPPVRPHVTELSTGHLELWPVWPRHGRRVAARRAGGGFRTAAGSHGRVAGRSVWRRPGSGNGDRLRACLLNWPRPERLALQKSVCL